MTPAGRRVVVVGGGLAGLTAADRLCAAGLEVQVLEARARVGGRLLTVASEAPGGGWFDLGATWHWGGQAEVAALAAGLGLTAFPQFDAGAALARGLRRRWPPTSWFWPSRPAWSSRTSTSAPPSRAGWPR